MSRVCLAVIMWEEPCPQAGMMMRFFTLSYGLLLRMLVLSWWCVVVMGSSAKPAKVIVNRELRQVRVLIPIPSS